MAYDTLITQGVSGNQALYHLSKASSKIDRISSNSLSLPTVHQLKHGLH